MLLWVAQGKSNGDIASNLGMSEKTVKQHVGNIFVGGAGHPDIFLRGG